ncbi:MAG: outer membrane protein OmpA-like peptidoglycan-associated protein [Crocinitomix sp.]|jgi:outer membrane protein OmpA-like peptidoglycan-associated protein
MHNRLLAILFFVFTGTGFAQVDTVKFGLEAYILLEKGEEFNIDSLLKVEPRIALTYDFYKKRYVETDLMYKITDNKGNGFDSLYGTRNMRPILHGVAYRGGANNYYHKTDKRNNHNPIPLDGMHGLCQEGFSKGIYLYRENFEDSPIADTCNCIDLTVSKLEYEQRDYFDSVDVYDMLKSTYESATMPEVGPVYLHCWNGWHASGYIGAVILKQFCDYSSWDAVNYWDLGTDGANTSPRYQTQRERIKDFESYPEFDISDSLKECLCPPLPENIDSTQLHIEMEHLVVVPEAIPIGFQIVLYNVKFGSGKTSFSNIAKNEDIVYLKTALDNDPNLIIEVGGYTDNSGSHAKNVTISRQRAKFVYDHLIESGYSTDRITYQGYGPAKPIYSNRYKSTRDGNRRIEIKIINKTTHSGDKLVDEKGYDKDVKTDAELKTSYLSYFFEHQNDAGMGSTFIIDSLAFASGSFDLPTSGYGFDNLNQLIQYLKDKKGVKANINGYTDSSGIDEKNQALSESRAKAVYDYLIAQGIAAERLIYKGYGSAKPIAPNRYLWGRDINRRIEVAFMRD